MKKILKITLVTALAVATILMTLVTSFAGNVSPDYVDVYTPTYNLRDFSFLASNTDESPFNLITYYVNLTNQSIYASDDTTNTREPTNLTIQPQINDPAPTFYIQTYTSLDSANSRLYTGVQVKDPTFKTTYNSVQTEISLHFGEMVLNPELISGAVNFFGILPADADVVSYETRVVYSGQCYFPLVEGGFRVVNFAINASKVSSAYPDGDNFRFSLAPSLLTDNNSFNKFNAKDFYQRVYDQLSPTLRNGLINPEKSTFFKDGDPIALRSYSVDATYIQLTDRGYYLPYCGGFNLELPASINGVVRPDEDFLRAWNTYEQRPVEFEDFSFVGWIETIVFGLGAIEFIPETGFYLLYPVVGSVALALLIWALKIFLGG